jgi:soluble lytic murein transglycosylase-like protein
MTRGILAALAIAGAVFCWAAPAAAGYGDGAIGVLAQVPNAREVARAKRCAPPFGAAGCPRVKRGKRPRADFRTDIAMLVEAMAGSVGMPARIARALVRVESGGDPRRRGTAGEWGLTQIKCQTARGLGFAGPCGRLADPATNLKFGLKHAALALRRGSIGFHQAGLGARRVSSAYVAQINAAMIRGR